LHYWYQVELTRLLAVVAETLGRGADLSVMANIATLVASTSRERRHFEYKGLSQLLATKLIESKLLYAV
jgi:hypothetical protein